MRHFAKEATRLIRINSVTANGNEELSNYIANLLQDRGLKVQIQQVTHSIENISKRQFNVIGILGDPLVDKKTRKGLLLNTHLDTVGPGLPENWTETAGDPFSAVMRDGRIYGLGSADVKLDFLCKLRAVERFRERKLKMPVYLVGTCGEEIGMFGAKYLIKSLALNPRFVVVGEPSELKVVYAHKCYSIYRVSIGYQLIERDARGFNRRIDIHSFGRSAHGSYPHLGVNAVTQALDFIQHAVDNGFEIQFTRVDGGDTVNKVPDRATAEFYLTSHQFEDFKRFFRETVRAQGLEAAFRVELGGLGDTGVRFLPDTIFPCIIDSVGFFRELATELESKKDDSYDPPFSTVSLGKLIQKSGGIELFFDLRILPDVLPEKIEKQVQEGIRSVSSKYPGLNITVTRERMNPGLNMALESDLVRTCRNALSAAGIPEQFSKKATSTEAAQYFQAGYEAVVFGPGVSMGNSHSPNEHNLLEHLEKATLFYEKLIETVCA